MKFNVLILVLLATFSCANERPPNKLPYNDKTVVEVENKLCALNDLLGELEGNIDKHQLGFVIVNDTIRYLHCIDNEGFYLDSLGCESLGQNINRLFSNDQKLRLLMLIKYFKSKRIYGTSYSDFLNSYMLVLEGSWAQVDITDSRYLFCVCPPVAERSINKDYVIRDFKNGLYLLSIRN